MRSLRLTNSEKAAVRSRWGGNAIYKAFRSVCHHNQQMMQRLDYSAEEVFYASMMLIDEIKAAGDEWCACIDGVGQNMRRDLRGYGNVCDDELKLAAGEVLSVVAIVVLFAKIESARSIALSLLYEIGDDILSMTIQREMIQSMSLEERNNMDRYAKKYMNGSERVSEQIAEIIEDEEYARELSDDETEYEWDNFLSKSNRILKDECMFNGKCIHRSMRWFYDFIKEYFVQRASKAYDWFALYRFLWDTGYLKDSRIASFNAQMKDWYKDAETPCTDGTNLYNFLSGYRPEEWTSLTKFPYARISAKAVRQIYQHYTYLKEKHDALSA